MNSYSDSSKKKEKQAAAHPRSQATNGSTSHTQFTDNRADVIDQRDMQRMANDSPQTKQFKALKKIIGRPPGKAPVQRTGKDAYDYIKRTHPEYQFMDGEKTIAKSSVQFYLNDPRSPLKREDEKKEFLRLYNQNNNSPVNVNDMNNDTTPEPPKHQLSEQEEITKIWAPSKRENAFDNAVRHYQKHVITQAEFNGKIRTLIEYVRAAHAFWKDPGGITTMKGDTGLVVKYDSVSGKYTFLAEENGQIATFFELKNTGNPDDIINQIVLLTAMDKGNVQELLKRIPVEKKEDRAPLPRQQDDNDPEDEDGSGDERTFVIDGMVMDEWDYYNYWEYKRGVDY